MKKLFIGSILTTLFVAILYVTNFIETNKSMSTNTTLTDLKIMTSAVAEDASGNEATCYSTYSTSTLAPKSTIWVCGSCVQTKASSYSDSGTCYF
jgi:hypothetical protein